MYLFKIKADATDIDVPAVRALSGLATFMIVLYRNQNIFSVNITVAAVILIAGLFAETLLVKFRINSLLLIGCTAILLAIATKAFIFPLLMMVFAVAVKYSYVQPSIEISENGIRVKKTYNNKQYNWDSFNNVVLKDGLLTLDFKNNKVLQLELDNAASPDQKHFNNFCFEKLVTQNRNADQTDLNG